MTAPLVSHLKSGWVGGEPVELIHQISATPHAISKLRSELRETVKNWEIENRSLFVVALEEVVTNIAEHGLGFDEKANIDVGIFVDGRRIGVVIQDHGTPFDPRKKRAKSPRRQFDKGADGGYGMYIFKRVFTEMDYDEGDECNTLVLYYDDKRVKIPN